MKNKNFWITISLVNLCLVALLGLTLRTKFVFPLSFLDYKNFLSAHSHFAFSGWVTQVLAILFIDQFLNAEQKQKKIYQWILWGIEINSMGMLISFPFSGYAFFSIVFSTVFIFFTYAFSWVFIKDLLVARKNKVVELLSIGAIISLVISSIGPFTLAYFMATKTGDAFLYRDAVYGFMHFQYNGFFTLSVFALFFNAILKDANDKIKRKMRLFAIFLCLSLVPSLCLSLLWHSSNIYIRGGAMLGCVLILIAVFFFSGFIFNRKIYTFFNLALARRILFLSMFAFGIKMIMQIGTIFPALGHMVFGFRPIIIGFLHLVFLGFVTFYVLAHLLQNGEFNPGKKITKFAFIYFGAAILVNETILFTDGMGRMLGTTTRIFPWLLWGAAVLLFTGAIWILIARLSRQLISAHHYS